MTESKTQRARKAKRAKYDRAISRIQEAIESGRLTRHGVAVAKKNIRDIAKGRETYLEEGLFGYGMEHNKNKQKSIRERQIRADMAAETSKRIVRGNYGIENWEFQQKMNKAYFGYDKEREFYKNYDASNELKREQVEAFYYATEPLWHGKSTYQTRNTVIINKLGVNTLEEAYEKVMSNPEIRALAELKSKSRLNDGKLNLDELSPEARQYYEAQEASDNAQSSEGSPEWVMMLPQFHKNSRGSWVIGEVSGEVEK